MRDATMKMLLFRRRSLATVPCILAASTHTEYPKRFIGNWPFPFFGKSSHLRPNTHLMLSSKDFPQGDYQKNAISKDTTHEEQGENVYTNMSPCMPPPPMAIWNGVLRFGLEVASLVGLAHFGWTTTWIQHSIAKPLLGVTLPVVAAAAWGTFNVPHDPSRGGGAPIRVSGFTRLGIEAVVLGCGGASLALWHGATGGVFAAATVVHYACYYPRIQWLLQQTGR